MAEVKETKAQRMERLKREKNPWEAFDEVRSFAAAGRESVLRNGPQRISNGGAFTPRETGRARSAARAGKAKPPSIS